MGRSTFVPALGSQSWPWPDLQVYVLPILLGQGVPLSLPGAPRLPLRLLRADRTFPDSSVQLVYAPEIS